MWGFLDSFSSEYRTFKRKAVTTVQNDYKEEVETEGTATDIIGMIFPASRNDKGILMVGDQVNIENLYYKFFYKKEYTLEKGDYIYDDEDGLKYKVCTFPKKQRVFDAVYDHNKAYLQLIK